MVRYPSSPFLEGHCQMSNTCTVLGTFESALQQLLNSGMRDWRYISQPCLHLAAGVINCFEICLSWHISVCLRP